MPDPRASLKAVILVGGPGTRLQPLTYDTPKAMVPVLNKPFLAHTIAYLKQFGIEDIILALNYLHETIQGYFGDGSQFGVRLAYCVEEEPMGTAGAVKNAGAYLDSTFVVLNGDVFTDLDIADMLACHSNNGAKATISLQWVEDPSAFGVVETDDDRRVRRFIEKPPRAEATTNWINAGTYILEPEVLELVPSSSHYMFEKGLFPRLLELDEPVYGYPFSGYWLDMGNPGKYLYLNLDILLSKTSSPLIHGSEDGIYCEQDATIHPSAGIEAPAVIGSRCRIDQGAHIRGPVVIGPDCQLGDGVRIENTVLWDNVHVGANARLGHCIVGSRAIIAPDSQISDCVVTPSQTTPLSHQ